jgi:hypothetical protein
MFFIFLNIFILSGNAALLYLIFKGEIRGMFKGKIQTKTIKLNSGIIIKQVTTNGVTKIIGG